MPRPPQTSPLVVTQFESVLLGRFAQPIILSGVVAEAVAHHLDQLTDAGPTRIVLNCANVQSLTSLIIGKLLSLDKKVSAAGGTLALCEVRPEVREIFDVVGLLKILRFYPTEEAARDDLAG
ncbi:MAG TPA: STAS domain-containing protein [Gemmataceae bacterium]|nr:STAS domain-containing protein [Gemmataceae bacterium]